MPKSDNKKRVHIFISGRVQGVFFRASTVRKANELGIKGWVRNLYRGQVEIVAEGDKEVLESMISWCHKGPQMSIVSDVKVEIEPYEGSFSSFSVTY